MHTVCLTRPDGTTAAERCCGQKPRSRFAAIVAAVELPPAHAVHRAEPKVAHPMTEAKVFTKQDCFYDALFVEPQ